MVDSKKGNLSIFYDNGTRHGTTKKTILLPPANEVWDKVIFLHLSVILFTGGGSAPGGMPGPRGCLVLGGVPGPEGGLLPGDA